MDDFDGDGLLDLVVTSLRPDRADGLLPQQGRRHLRGPDRGGRASPASSAGSYCVQTDYNNDGRMDIFIPRGAWLRMPMRPTPAPQQRRRHVHRRHRGGRAARPGQLQLRVAGPTTTTTAGSTCSSAARRQPNRLYHNRGDGTFEEVAATAGVAERRRTLLQGGGLDRLRQRRLSRPVPQQPARRRRALSATTATGRFADVTSPDGHRRAPRTASRAGPGTTTTTAGSTSSPPATTASLEDVVKGLIGAAARPASEPALPQPRAARRFEDVTGEAGPRHGLRRDGEQLRRLRQRRLPRLLPRHRRAEPAHAGPQPDVQERRRQAVRRDHRRPPAPATSRRATASPAATGTATATSTSSSRWAAPSTATSTTTSSSRTPARGTTG